MGLIATARRGTTASQDAPKRPGKGKTRGEVRDASQATGTRQSATSSQGEPTQAAQPISGSTTPTGKQNRAVTRQKDPKHEKDNDHTTRGDTSQSTAKQGAADQADTEQGGTRLQ